MRDFLRICFMAVVCLLSEFLAEIYWEKVNEEIIFFIICLVGDVWPGVRTVAARLINQHSSYKATANSWAVLVNSPNANWYQYIGC